MMSKQVALGQGLNFSGIINFTPFDRMQDIHQPIFVVEDSEEDFFLLRRAFKKSFLGEKLLRRFHSGESFLQYVSEKREEDRRNMASIILMDINLPGLSGLELLERLRNVMGVKTVPIIILSTSNNERDIQRGYQLGANTYIMKPFEYEELIKLVDNLTRYWFSDASLDLK